MRSAGASSRRVTVVVGLAAASWLLGVPIPVTAEPPRPGGPAVSGGPAVPIDLTPAYVEVPITRPDPAAEAVGTDGFAAAADGRFPPAAH